MRKWIITVLLCLLPTSILAGDFPEIEEDLTVKGEITSYGFIDTSYTAWNWVTLIAMVAANSADAWTTNEGINVQGTCKESAIPAKWIMGEYPSTGAIIAFKAVATGLVIAIVELGSEDKNLQRNRNIAYGINAAVMGFVSIRNYGECIK